MPITYAKTDEQIEEERRLLYVGVTRARLHLALSWSLSRSPGGRASRRASRFLDGLRPGSGAVRRRVARRARSGAASSAATGRRRWRGGPSTAARPAAGSADRTLTDAGEIKLMRCEDCPSELDEALYERLCDWRAEQAGRSGSPRTASSPTRR